MEAAAPAAGRTLPTYQQTVSPRSQQREAGLRTGPWAEEEHLERVWRHKALPKSLGLRTTMCCGGCNELSRPAYAIAQSRIAAAWRRRFNTGFMLVDTAFRYIYIYNIFINININIYTYLVGLAHLDTWLVRASLMHLGFRI